MIDVNDGTVDYWWTRGNEDGTDEFDVYIGGSVRAEGHFLHVTGQETTEHEAGTATVPISRIAKVSACRRACFVEVDGSALEIAICVHVADAKAREAQHREMAALIVRAMSGEQRYGESGHA